MSIGDLSKVLKIFGGSDINEDERKELYQEVLLMVLARASSSDSNIHELEIEAIQEMVQQETGNKVTVQEVRKAARTELYETTPIEKYLSSVRKKLANADRVRLVHLLADVVKSDTAISVLEIDFFNKVATALQATPAEIIGITSH